MEILALAFANVLSCSPLTAAKDFQWDVGRIRNFHNTYQTDQLKVAASWLHPVVHLGLIRPFVSRESNIWFIGMVAVRID